MRQHEKFAEISPSFAIPIARLLSYLEKLEEEKEKAYLFPGIPKGSSVLNGIRKRAVLNPVAKGGVVGALASVPFALKDLAEGDILRAILLDPAIGATLGASLAGNFQLLKKLKGQALLNTLK
jgi:hypothetical protein